MKEYRSRFSSIYLGKVEEKYPMLEEYPVTPLEPAIVDIEVNNEASSFLPPDFQYLCTPEFIAQCAVMTCPDNEYTTAYTCTPIHWRRSLTPIKISSPQANGITYGENIHAGIVQSKGNLYCGASYGNKGLIAQADPWGYFGSQEAALESDIANKLISCGFPAGLVLGTCILDPDILKDHINEVYSSNPDLALSLTINLQKVIDNGDVPAVMVRLTDTYSRLIDMHGEFRQQAYTECMQHFCNFDRKLKNRLLGVAYEAPLTLPEQSDIDALIEGTQEIIFSQAYALETTLRQYPELKRYPSLQQCLIASKDIGLQFLHVDFEQSVESSTTKKKVFGIPTAPINSYYASMMNTVKSYYLAFLQEHHTQQLNTNNETITRLFDNLKIQFYRTKIA